MKPESNNIQDYLQITPIIDWDNPAILEKLSELTKELKYDVDKACCLYEWVRDIIPHSKDINANIVTCKASEVLLKRTGTCYSKTILLAAMLRAEKIPTGFCYQVLRQDPPLEGTILHALNGIFIPSIKKWIRVDPRGNSDSLDGQFSIDNEKLCFPIESEKSVLIYETIYIDPAPVVVNMLMRFDNLNEMLQYLPERID
ncbi:MAG: transglutaminase family protein [Promethearchaeota archaeon]